jgi:hypothetical protein
VPDDPEDLPVLKLKTHIIQCSKIIEFFRQVAGCDHESVLVSIRLIHGSTYTLGFWHRAGDKMRAILQPLRANGFLDRTCTTTYNPDSGKLSGLKISDTKKDNVSIDDYLTDT